MGGTEVSLSVSPASVSVDAAGESFTVTVTSNTNYSVEISDDWLTLNSNISGLHTFTAAANMSGTSRTATITISTGDLSGIVTVPVIQSMLSLSVSPLNVSIVPAGGSFAIIVICDVDYSISISDDWLTLDSDSGGTFTFTVAANASVSSRIGTITVTAGDVSSIVYVSQAGPYDVSGGINGYGYVDLGLSVRWATCNIGADCPEDYGNYYAWGETETKDYYDSSNSVTYDVSMSDFSGDARYDAATANWGGSWRMPTESEIKELRTHCTWTWDNLNGVNGYKVTGTDGNSIFLPAAGHYNTVEVNGQYVASLRNVGYNGYYWSSTPYGLYWAASLYFYSSERDVYGLYRYDGQSIRPVSD